MKTKTAIDVLVIAPHPDDAELGAGGFLAKMKKRGYKTAIVDLTLGERGTKGTPDVRSKEATAAAEVLGLYQRLCLNLGDSQLADQHEQRLELISVLRILRPRLLLTTAEKDEHPDHRAAYHLARAAFFQARLPKIDTGRPFHAPEQLWTYGVHIEDPLSFIVDISDEFEQKRRAVECYRSQFVDPKLPEGYRYAGVSDYLGQIEWRGRLWGQKIGVRYGEAFAPVTPLRLNDPFAE